MTDCEDRIVEGSGNVFADLGLPDADELLLNAELTRVIRAELRNRQATPAQTARLLGTTHLEATKLLKGDFVRLRIERLLHFLTALGRDVDIVVHPRAADQPQAKLRVVSAAA